nr:MAG TPA: zinc-ribbon domain protein [Caudoviricetes sp.]
MLYARNFKLNSYLELLADYTFNRNGCMNSYKYVTVSSYTTQYTLHLLHGKCPQCPHYFMWEKFCHTTLIRVIMCVSNFLQQWFCFARTTRT